MLAKTESMQIMVIEGVLETKLIINRAATIDRPASATCIIVGGARRLEIIPDGMANSKTPELWAAVMSPSFSTRGD